jgi:hypothetical protein
MEGSYMGLFCAFRWSYPFEVRGLRTNFCYAQNLKDTKLTSKSAAFAAPRIINLLNYSNPAKLL